MTALILKPDTPMLAVTNIIDIINKNKTSRIILTSISYSKLTAEVPIIGVVGIARNRQSLVSFTQELERDEHIVSVDLPVSSFAKETDIPFSLNIKIK